MNPPTRLLFLVHGYGMSEIHMATLGGLCDPERRFTHVAPRGPIEFPTHASAAWMRRRKRQEPGEFERAVRGLGERLDRECAALGTRGEDVVLGGFSQGAILAFALAAAPARPVPAGVFSWCGMLPFDRGVPTDFGRLAGVPVLLHATADDAVIPLAATRTSADELRRHGAALSAREYAGGHDVSLEMLLATRAWLAER
jgi:phospholipase/carboxylesterase